MFSRRMRKVITSGIDSLIVGTEEFAQGNLEHCIDVRSKDELGDLAHAFNKMTFDLNQANIRLHNASPDIS